MTHSFQRRLKAAGLPRQRLYDYRHACATILLEKGADLREIMGQLRHSTIKLTADTYTHVRSSVSRRNADRINTAFSALVTPPDPEPAPDSEDQISPALLQN